MELSLMNGEQAYFTIELHPNPQTFYFMYVSTLFSILGSEPFCKLVLCGNMGSSHFEFVPDLLISLAQNGIP